MEQNSNHVSYQPMQVWLQVQHHDLALPLSQLVDKTYCRHVGMGEVLSLAPKQKKLPDICAAIDLLNQELSDFRYLSYAFLRGFTSHLAQQCALPDGYICNQQEGGYGLNPELLSPLWRSIGTLQDVLDCLEASLPTGGRRPFQVDSDYYWIHQIAQADEQGKVINAKAVMHMKIHMALRNIKHTLL